MRKNKIFWGAFILAIFVFGAVFLLALGPAEKETPVSVKRFEVAKGDGFFEIARRLKEERVIKSKLAFDILLLSSGAATRLKPGSYKLDPAKSGFEILRELVAGPTKEVETRIPDGASAYEIDAILANAGVVRRGKFSEYAFANNLEGRFFPDTYRFFASSTPEDVADKILLNFRSKTRNIFDGKGEKEIRDALIMASLIEKEVSDKEERKIVSGILKKRLAAGIPLQADATICYIKKVEAYPREVGCYPYTRLDFKKESAYNTYLHRGLPPGPIGNAGFSAIEAALSPKKSPYLYYLSDPKTGKTVFARTLDEQNENRAKYLGL